MEKIVVAILNYMTADVDVISMEVKSEEDRVQNETVEEKLTDLGYSIGNIEYMFTKAGKMNLNIDTQ